MLTTTPRFRPCVGATPSPATRSSPPGSTSATTTITLAVPMSRPTTRSLFSLAMGLPWFLRGRGGRNEGGGDAAQPHRVAVGMAQVGVFQVALEAAGDLAHACAGSARCAPPVRPRCRGRARRVAPLSSSTLPRAAARQLQRHRLQRAARRTAAPGGGTAPASAPTLPSGPLNCGRSSSSTSPTLASKTSPKSLTRRSLPSSPCHSATGWCSSRRTASRSGQMRRSVAWRTQGTRLEGGAGLVQVDGEEVAGQPRRGVGADGGHAVALQVAFELDDAEAQPRRARQPQQRGRQQRQRRPARTACWPRRSSAGCRRAARCRRRWGGSWPWASQASVRGAPSSAACGQQLQAQLLVADAGGARRHRHQRMAGHAGRGVHLEQEGLAVAGAAASGRRGPSRGSRARGRRPPPGAAPRASSAAGRPLGQW